MKASLISIYDGQSGELDCSSSGNTRDLTAMLLNLCFTNEKIHNAVLRTAAELMNMKSYVQQPSKKEIVPAGTEDDLPF